MKAQTLFLVGLFLMIFALAGCLIATFLNDDAAEKNAAIVKSDTQFDHREQNLLNVMTVNQLIEIFSYHPGELYLGDLQLLDRPLQELAIALNSTHDVFEPVEVGLESDELGIVLVEVDDWTDGVEVYVLPA